VLAEVAAWEERRHGTPLDELLDFEVCEHLSENVRRYVGVWASSV